ncbi:increased DNA methylation 1-like [Diospyros lotus]|uniref:increased DNA methylation 1-like n=1 Tax=Diospyros lotus TaxID=55363 RepID=UPI0022510A84|nr:increased DNA methylation 1-like [Diospyros lotus]
MPFIGTHEKHRGKGMCRKFMAIIESALSYLEVENLVIPSSKEKVKSWKNSYGFQPISHSMKNDLRDWNALMFHDSIRLQKVLPISKGREDEQAENKERGLPDLNLEAPPSD